MNIADSKYIYLRMIKDDIWYVVKLVGKRCYDYKDSEHWEYVDVLSTNSPYYHVSENNPCPTLDMAMLNKVKYPDIEIRFLKYAEVVAYTL